MKNSEFRIQNSEVRSKHRSLELRGSAKAEKGFTLIELLAAMAILVIITLIVSRLFQQASVAWDTGLRKAESTMKGRAVADFIAQDLASAVVDGEFISDFSDAKKPKFWVLDVASGTRRAMTYVTYSSDSTKIARTVEQPKGTIIEPETSLVELKKPGETLDLNVIPVFGTNSLPLYAAVIIKLNGSKPVQYQSTAYFNQNKRNTF